MLGNDASTARGGADAAALGCCFGNGLAADQRYRSVSGLRETAEPLQPGCAATGRQAAEGGGQHR
jgi:hypothetical protein